MALLKFFRVPKHQKYDYKPRFWDPKEEELQKRLEQIELAKKGGVDAVKSRISGGFRKGYATNYKSRRSQVFRSNMILLGIVAILLLMSYYFITKYLPEIAAALGNTSS